MKSISGDNTEVVDRSIRGSDANLENFRVFLKTSKWRHRRPLAMCWEGFQRRAEEEMSEAPACTEEELQSWYF